MQIEGWIHELNKVVKGEELVAHARLVAEEIAFLETRQLDLFEYEGYGTDHPVHEANKSPKSYSIILLNRVDWG